MDIVGFQRLHGPLDLSRRSKPGKLTNFDYGVASKLFLFVWVNDPGRALRAGCQLLSGPGLYECPSSIRSFWLSEGDQLALWIDNALGVISSDRSILFVESREVYITSRSSNMMRMTAITIRTCTQGPKCGRVGITTGPKKPSSHRTIRTTITITT